MIQDHHPAYVSWATFLANEQRIAANYTRSGAHPPREGTALLQGIVLCGSCGRQMQILYSSTGKAMYDCSHARSDHTNTPACRSIIAAIVDAAVARRMLAVVMPTEIAVHWLPQTKSWIVGREVPAPSSSAWNAPATRRRGRVCVPPLRARQSSRRSQSGAPLGEKLSAVADAEAAMVAAHTAMTPLPPRAELEALASDLPGLWNAATTSNKDRKRLLRTLVGDVTLISQPAETHVRVGIHWRSGRVKKSWCVARSRPPSVVAP